MPAGRGRLRQIARDLRLSFLEQLPITQAALEFALERHAGQRRPADGAFFVLHPLEVAFLLERSGYADRVIAAAVLHDVLENTNTKHDELEAHFGREVTGLVATVTDDPSIADEEERKSATRERVRAIDGDAAAVYAADKISKVRELRTLIARGVSDRDATTKLGRYRNSLSMLDQTIPDSRLIEILRFELEALALLPPETRE